MSTQDYKPEEVEKAKKLARSSLATSICRFPCHFIKALIIGNPKQVEDHSRINSATATLVDLGVGPLALTCNHVIDKYIERKAKDEESIMHLGDLSFSPDGRLKPTANNIDIAAIDLRGLDLEKITNYEEIGGSFFQPSRWPPTPVSEGNWVIISGFPAVLRESVAPRTFSFGTYSIGLVQVASVQKRHFFIQFEREYWETTYEFENKAKEFKSLSELGGMSGSPVFIERKTNAGIYVFDLVGIVHEYQKDLDLLKVASSQLILPDGSISET